MACVLKIGRGSQLYRVGLEEQPDLEAVDAAVSRVLPGCGAADATFSGDGEAHLLTLDSFEAFLASGRALASGQVVLRLDVPELFEELPSAAQPTLLQSAALATPAKLAKSGTHCVSWAEGPAEEDQRPLDELVAGLQEVPKNGLKKRCKKKDTQKSTSQSGAQGANSDLAQVGDDPLAPGKRDPDTDCGEFAEAECDVISTSSSEEDPDEDDLDPGPPLPDELRRSSSCPACAIPHLAAGIAAPQDLPPPEPSEVWPPTPDSTPQHSPRFDYQMDCLMAADLLTQQQFVWVPVLVPVF